MARPILKIDWDQLDKLCGLQCTKSEIAEFLEISEDTIERAIKREKGIGYAEYYEQKASKGRISLRRKQYETAMGGNVTMLIWLGKQYLGQSEKHEQKNIDMKLVERVKEIESLSDDELKKLAGK